MKTKDEIAGNLLKAKEILQTNGRTTGTLLNLETGCSCLLGAIGIAVLGDVFRRRYVALMEPYEVFGRGAADEVGALADHIEGLGTPLERVYRFNDLHPGSEGDAEVFDLIDQTVASLTDG